MSLIDRILALFGRKPPRVDCPSKWRKRCEMALADAERKTGLKLRGRPRVSFRAAERYVRSPALGVEVGVWRHPQLGIDVCAVTSNLTITAAVNSSGDIPQFYIEHEMAHCIANEHGLAQPHCPEFRGKIFGW
jgi:hypothetical protein